MRFNDSRRHNALLASTLRKDNTGIDNVKGRSINQIWTAMENYNALHMHKARFGFDVSSAQQKSLHRFANGHSMDKPGQFELKARLWDYYVWEGIIKVDEFGDDIDSFAINADIFFKEESIIGSIHALKGRYFGFKRSIWTPNVTVTKYFAHIIPSSVSNCIACITERHYNRSLIAQNSVSVPEDWSGIVMLRSASMFGIVREEIMGTPRSFVFSVPMTNRNQSNNPLQLLGDEIEVVERSTKTPINSSPILLERIESDASDEELWKECDLMSKIAVKRQYPHVWHHLFGGDR